MKAEKLIKEINKKKDNWNERSQFKFGKVGNLSMSDLDTLELYASQYMKNGNLRGLMAPRGGIKEVLEMYGIKEESSSFGW